MGDDQLRWRDAEILPSRVSGEGKNAGRPGMPQWRILVLGVLRLGLNADYDRIQDLANLSTATNLDAAQAQIDQAARWAAEDLPQGP